MKEWDRLKLVAFWLIIAKANAGLAYECWCDRTPRWWWKEWGFRCDYPRKTAPDFDVSFFWLGMNSSRACISLLENGFILDLKASPRAQKVESHSLPKCAKATFSAEYSRVIPLSFNQISIQAIKDCFGSSSISTNDGRPSTKLGRDKTKTFSHCLQLLSWSKGEMQCRPSRCALQQLSARWCYLWDLSKEDRNVRILYDMYGVATYAVQTRSKTTSATSITNQWRTYLPYDTFTRIS